MYRIYYYDGSTIENEDPGKIEPVGVICILQPCYDKPGYHLQHRSDFYLLRQDWYDDIYWQGADEAGKETYMRRPGYKIVLYGETIPNEEYKRIHDLADAEMVRLNGELRLNG